MMDTIYEKSLAGEITKADALKLINDNHFELFDIADKLRKEIVGDEVTFVVNKNVHFTDQCLVACNFCSFRNSIGYEMSIEEILDAVTLAEKEGATEVCLFGGVMPHMTIEFYSNLISSVKENSNVDLHTLSPVEIYYCAKHSKTTTKEVLLALKDAGLDTLTGASAEILVDSVREKICPNKVSTADWIRIITEAHEVGIKSSATMMYGTLETWEDRIDHLFILRDIQRKTGGFTEFVPMTFLNENNVLGAEIRGASGLDDLKLHAIARVIFGRDIPNIQAAWIKVGYRMAQLLLSCGANDLGGTMMGDQISLSAGASYGEYLPKNEMVELINAIGRIPVERTTQYDRINSK